VGIFYERFFVPLKPPIGSMRFWARSDALQLAYLLTPIAP
jgi:hypothetical protein